MTVIEVPRESGSEISIAPPQRVIHFELADLQSRARIVQNTNILSAFDANFASTLRCAAGMQIIIRRVIMVDYRVSPGQVNEDQLTASIEKHTSQIPSSVYLAAALGAMAVSAALHLANKEHRSLFIGQWAAPFLLLGIYNKLVKQHGSDASSRTQPAA
jgi:hypothetical protein